MSGELNMTVEPELEFLTRRAKHEAAAILRTVDPAAKAAHEHLGAAYRGRIAILEGARSTSGSIATRNERPGQL
jgi:hypothetical protein